MARQKYNKTIRDYLFTQGSLEKEKIAQEAGLIGANAKMNQLIKTRNDEIWALYDALPKAKQAGIGAKDFETQMYAIIDKYKPLLQAEAQRQFKSGDPTTQAPTSAAPEQNKISGTSRLNVPDVDKMISNAALQSGVKMGFASAFGVAVTKFSTFTVTKYGSAARLLSAISEEPHRLRFDRSESSDRRLAAGAVQVTYEINLEGLIDAKVIADKAKSLLPSALTATIKTELTKIGEKAFADGVVAESFTTVHQKACADMLYPPYDVKGKQATCAQLKTSCTDTVIGQGIRSSCPVACGTCKTMPAAVPVAAPSSASEDKANTMMFVGIGIGAVGLLCCGGGIIYFIMAKRTQKQVGGTNAHPIEGDSNVVMGRPVQPGEGGEGGESNGKGDVAPGAPVATGSSQEDEKGKA
jgi:hypothetical protein